MMLSKALEKPLSRHEKSLRGYASARVLEALLESMLALEFLARGYTRNAAGKAFQAWRALTAALLALERDKIAARLDSEQRKWLLRVAIPRVPSTRLKPLSNLVEEAGYPNYGPYTDRVLNLHDYQCHGPDLALSKYRSRGEAAQDILYVIKRLVEIIERRIKPRLEKEKLRNKEHQEALEKLRRLIKQQ